MSSNAQAAVRFAKIAQVLETEDDLKAFQKHLDEIVCGDAFKGSLRSGQFLRHVAEQAIAGHADSLKERIIGIELFGRLPTYDTGEDAIVRVTASDVRKRLGQHYAAHPSISGFRITLPLGSYVPEIIREAPPAEPIAVIPVNSVSVPFPANEEGQPVFQPAAILSVENQQPVEQRSVEEKARKSRRWLVPVAVLLIAANVGVLSYLLIWPPRHLLYHELDSPIADLFPAQLPLRVITSDPNIGEIQGLTGQDVTLSDYADRHYIPNPAILDPKIIQLSRDILRGDKAAAVDTAVAARVAAELPRADATQLVVTAARDLRLSDLLMDGNFILLGSFRSNPWTLFYNDRLDFLLVMDPTSHQEIVENVHPRAGESAAYVPTAKGYATGESYATISYLANPDHRGRVLLLAGANAEGTLAAGQMATNFTDLSAALQKCGVRSLKSQPSFQLLLRVSTIGGSSRHADVVACHQLVH